MLRKSFNTLSTIVTSFVFCTKKEICMNSHETFLFRKVALVCDYIKVKENKLQTKYIFQIKSTIIKIQLQLYSID